MFYGTFLTNLESNSLSERADYGLYDCSFWLYENVGTVRMQSLHVV